MKNTMIYLMLSLSLASCYSEWQLVSLQSNNLTVENEKMFYSDSLVDINYEFYTTKGVMRFTIFNRSNAPVYVDWKNSFFIMNNQSYPYWEDRMIVETTSTSQTRPSILNKDVLNTSEYAKEEITRENRVTMIPPQTQIEISRFKVYTGYHINAFWKDTLQEPRSWMVSKRKVEIYHSDFDQEDSPLKFRNYITFGTSEDFKQPIHYDFHFWIAALDEMDSRQIVGDWQSENYPSDISWPTKYEPYKASNRFVIK